MRIYVWMWLAVAVISTPLYALRTPVRRITKCGKEVQRQRFFTPKGVALRNRWRYEERVALAHGFNDPSYRDRIEDKHLYVAHDSDAYHVAAAYAAAFHQFSKYGTFANPDSIDQVKHVIASVADQYRDTGIQIELAFTPGTMESLSAKDWAEFMEWVNTLVNDFPDCILILYSPDPLPEIPG